MQLHKYIAVIGLSLLFINCEDKTATNSLSISTNSKTYTLGDTLKISLNNPKKLEISTVSYLLDDKEVEENTVLKDITLGNKSLTAKVTVNGETKTIQSSIKVYNNKIPAIYTYEIVNTYPHDITSYTQGLEFYNNELYESTGQRKESKLRKVNFETGEVLNNHNLDNKYFGEGLTILNNKVYQLTWQANTGFVYDVDTFEKISSFKYGKSKEGWGLCNDGKAIYKSDGTEKIWKLNPDTLTEESYIEAYTEKGKIPRLNELEYISGKIYANIYQKNGVVIINPKNGGVEGVIDFSPLRKEVKQHDELDVLNGIAYHPERKTIFVTGKNWDKLFEVTIKKK